MLKEMDYVYAVYKEKSFSRAAQKLFISQPALSATIKKVELELGVPLFNRSTNPVSMTEAGEYYIRSIEKIMSIQNDMHSYFGKLSGLKNGSIGIGSATFFCTYILPPIIQKFQKKYPRYRVNLFELNAAENVEKLKHDEIDFALDVEPMDSNIFESIIWNYENIVLAVPSSYPINNTLAHYCLTFEDIHSGKYLDPNIEAVDLKCFSNEPFLFLKPCNDMYRRGLAMCKNAGFSPDIVMFLDQLMTSYYIACEGRGIAFIRDTLAHYVQKTNRICFYKLDDSLSIRPITLSYKKTKSLSVIAEDFMQFTRNENHIAKAL